MTKLFEQGKSQVEQGPRLADIRKEVLARMKEHEDADAETAKKAAERKKRFVELEAKLSRERALLARMEADCLSLMLSDREKKQTSIETAREQRRADVHAGKISIRDFHDEMAAFQKREQDELEKVSKELVIAIKAVREKGRAVIQLEKEYWETQADYYYLSSYPSEAGLGELKKMIQEMSARTQSLAYHYRNANTELDKVKDRLNRAQGNALTAGWAEDELRIEQVRALPLRPEIGDEYLPSLYALIREIEAYEAKRIETGQQGGSYFIRCSYFTGKERPWEWLCRNSDSPIIQMSKTKNASESLGVIAMSNLKPRKSEA